jgi:SEC-C motif domain protein
MTDDQACPCGSGKPYAGCCAAYVDGSILPETAERLMRTRYSAYVHGREDYLLRTWHASTRPASLALGAAAAVKWLGLKIVRTEGGGGNDAEGLVEFVARYKVQGKAERLHEVSRFVRQEGQWFYLDGDAAP